MRLFCFLTGILFCCNTAFAQDTLSLRQAIQIGLENNFDILIAKNNQLIAKNNNSLGNAGFLPSANLYADLTKETQDTEQVFADGRKQNVDNAKSTNKVASGEIQWVIFDGTQMFVNYQQLNELEQAEAISTEITIENKVAEISSAYYLVILQQAQQKVFQESLVLSQERLDIAKAKYNVGKASKLEYLTAQVDYNADKSALIQQNEVLYNAKVSLNNLLNRVPDTSFEVPNEIAPDLTLQMEVLREAIVATNPNLLLAQRNQNIAYLEAKRLRAGYYPQIALTGGFNYNSLEAQAGFVLLRNSNGPYYGITGTWNIFDGFNRKRGIQNAKIEIENTLLQTERLKQELLAELEKNFMDYTNNITLVELEEENLDVAKENTQIALERYRLGNTNNLELREVQQNAVEAESRLINAIYSTKLAEIELLRLSSKIIESQG